MALVARVAAFPKAYPFNFNLMVATVKTSGADLMTQTTVEKKQLCEIDWRRNVRCLVADSTDFHARRPSRSSAASTWAGSSTGSR